MKKTYFIRLLMLMLFMVVAFLGQNSIALANQEQKKTEAGIAFDGVVKSEEPKNPIYEPEPPKSVLKSGALPYLGQMLTSFILLLLGTAFLILFFGVIVLNKIKKINL